jgi:hypothetical protein
LILISIPRVFLNKFSDKISSIFFQINRYKVAPASKADLENANNLSSFDPFKERQVEHPTS